MTVASGTSRISCPANVDTATLSGGPNTITLMNGAWIAFNIDGLLQKAIRGDDLLVPGADGVLARDRYLDKIEDSLPMIFDGNVDRDGNSYSPMELMEGLELNRRDFIDNAVTPPASPATFTIEVTVADGTVLEGPLHCEGFRWARHQAEGLARAVWRVSLPLGLTEVGS